MDMNIQKYRSFVKTVECGSFTKAAELLNYSQSGISRMIGDLEREWNVVLLERNKGGVKLTGDGMLLPYAKNLLTEYEKLQRQVEELGQLQSGLIRIGTFSSVATHWLPNVLMAFQKDYPQIRYELLLGDYVEIEDWISEGRVDCGFVRLPVQTELKTVFLEQDPFLAVIPEDHPLKDCEKFPITAFCTEPFILLEKGANREVSDIFERCRLTPNVRITTWDDYAVMSMVESGLGIGLLPRLILKRTPYRILTKELQVPAYRNIGLALRDWKTASLAVKKWMEYLRYR